MKFAKRALPLIVLSTLSVSLAPQSAQAARLVCLFSYTRGLCDDGTFISCFDGSGNLTDCDQAAADAGCEGHGGLANLVTGGFGEAVAGALTYDGSFPIGDDDPDLEVVGEVSSATLYAECPTGEIDTCEDGAACSEAPEEAVCDGEADMESAVYTVAWGAY